MFNFFKPQTNKATELYNRLIDLNKISSYKKYLVILATNGFKLSNNDVFLILNYSGDEHIINVLTLRDYFYDLMIPSKIENNNIVKRYPIRLNNDINVGDIFYQIHGIDNTICNFYKVHSVKKGKNYYRNIKVKLLENEVISTDINGNITVLPSDKIKCEKSLNIVSDNHYNIVFSKEKKNGSIENEECINYDKPLKKWDGKSKDMNYTTRILKKNK